MNVTFANAATAVMSGLSLADWRSVLGIFSLALGSISHINYTAVTDEFKQAQDPGIQTSLKNMSEHALDSFDYATSGMTSLFSLLRDGVISEDKKLKTKRSEPSDLKIAEKEMGNVEHDVKAAMAAYEHENEQEINSDNDNDSNVK